MLQRSEIKLLTTDYISSQKQGSHSCRLCCVTGWSSQFSLFPPAVRRLAMLVLPLTLAGLSLVSCLPEPEAGLGVEHLHTLSR